MKLEEVKKLQNIFKSNLKKYQKKDLNQKSQKVH